MMASPPPKPAPEIPASPVTIEEFRKIEFKTAKVLEVSEHPSADRLWVLKVQLGPDEQRTIVAGIRPFYPKEQLIGKNIVLVANMKPMTIRGVDSSGMLLAAKDDTEFHLW